jgi:prophage DNA circulation protein
MTVTSKERLLPPKEQIREIKGILSRMVIQLLDWTVDTGPRTANLRRLCGNLLARFDDYLVMNVVGQSLLATFRAATDANITLNAMDEVLNQLYAETPTYGGPSMVQQAAIVFALAQQSRIIQKTEFNSRDDVEAMMKRIRASYDRARDIAADEMESSAYQSLTALAAALSRYLADTARPLPRMVTYELRPQPALRAANYIYGDGSRWEELVSENKIIHPAFCPNALRALSA